MNLFNLTAQYQRLLEVLQEADVSADDEAYKDTLEAIDDGFDDKIEGYAYVIKQLESDEKALTNLIQNTQDKRKRVRKNIARMKKDMQDSMEAVGKKRVKTPIFTIYIRNNRESLVVENEEVIPLDYFKKVKPKLQKQKVLDALSEGKEIDGVSTQRTRSVIIR